MRYRKAMELLKNEHTAWVVLLISLLLTGIAGYVSYSVIRSGAQQRFDFQTREISSAITKRLLEYETVLRAGAGFVSASGQVERAGWRQFVSDLALQENFSGFQGLGYSQVIAPAEMVRHVEQMRREGFADYAVHPAGPRDIYTSIIFIEPFDWRNQRAFGYDMFAEPVRREAMQRARDSGQPAVSGRVRLRQESDEDVQHGFLMYMPVYAKGKAMQSLDERRRSIRGFVYSPVRAGNFMKGLSEEVTGAIDLSLYDGEEAAAESLLYTSRSDVGDMALSVPATTGFSTRMHLPVSQRVWSLHLQARPDFLSDWEKLQPMIIVVGGTLIDLFVFYLIASIGRQKRQLEVLSQQLTERLQESEVLLGSAMETIGEAFVVFDRDDRLAFFNEEYRQVYRTSAPVIEIGRTFEEILRYGAERGQYREAAGRVDEWVAQRLAAHRQGNTMLIQQIDDGRWLKIRERKTPAGHTVGFRVDVTEVYQAKEAAEAASRAKSQFLATMSHEIRTPMNGILGMAQVLLASQMSDAERLDCARAILRSGDSLQILLNDILDLAKVEAGKFELNPVECSPVALLAEAVRLFDASARHKQLTLQASPALSEQAYYLADAARLRQMLSNLVGNAVKFTWRGEIQLAVRQVELQADGALLEFSVSDTGIGIPADKISRLFEPFSQLDASATRQHGGTGLGLSLVRNFARLMGGDAGVASEEGKGSRFWFRVLAKPTQASGVVAAGCEASFPQQCLSGHVLVVEDDPIHQKLVLAALTKLGLSARLVEDGQQAVDAFLTGEHFDLVLMDICMPVLSGYQATERILRWHKARQQVPCPIIALTANAYDEDREYSNEVGMADFLPKPVDFSELARVLGKWLSPGRRDVAQRGEDASKALDVDALLKAIDELMPLLVQHKFDAFGRFKLLKAMVAGSDLAVDLENIGRLLNSMEFEQVIDRLRQLSEELTRECVA